MDIRKVKKLIEMLEESNLNEIEIKEGEEAVKLVKSNPIPGNFISSAPAIISEPTQQSPIAMPSAPSSEATVTQEISQTSLLILHHVGQQVPRITCSHLQPSRRNCCSAIYP